MGRIVTSGAQNVSLDAVVQDPRWQEGFSLGAWFVGHGGKNLKQWVELARADELNAQAWRLGRRSYEYFGERWRSRQGELGDRLTAVPKYVVSSTLTDPVWNNTTGVEGDAATRVSQLKQPNDAGWTTS